MHYGHTAATCQRAVSVLFSEPKIPQYKFLERQRPERVSFSALQRAENSSIIPLSHPVHAAAVFQCSSASRKFLNLMFRPLYPCATIVSVLFSEPKIPQFIFRPVQPGTYWLGFSALQRAENSSILGRVPARRPPACFSALQRAENSSIASQSDDVAPRIQVSVLFSEPKIPQYCAKKEASNGADYVVSVLFSEPKIPQ